ncbi:MAG TPA: hypothetical protein VKV04_24470, partial [Verrucomicrobiae bacterium]|nr:hypothetical protein [Verrucomicrobiae bacterium]
MNVNSDTNWSTAANWSPTGIPGSSSVALFQDTTGVGDTTINSVVDTGFSIASLVFTNRILQQNLLIANGVTLNLNGSLLATNGGGTSGMVPIATIS